ncbi:MAG: phosphotransferase family protein [Aggregatilineales bacterium]
MTSSTDILPARLQTYLSERLNAPVTITRFTPLIGGACQDNYAIDLRIGDNPVLGEYVLRTDKGRALALSLSRVVEYHVIEAAYRGGVKAPEPFLLEPSPDVIGHPFYLMARIPGTAIARKVLTDSGLAAARAKLPGELAEQLARIHAITLEHGGPPLPIPKKPPVQSALEQARKALDALTEPLPALELGLRWLQAKAPSESRVTLVHGDFRTGNFMVTPDGLSGVLDWEFAHYGDPLEDVAWICLRDWRFGRIDQPVGGFADRETFYHAYEVASGWEIDPALVHYWEVFGNFNWATGAVQQAQRHLSGADRSIELASIGRRVPEMSYEMLRLIERGPIPRK